MKQTKRVEGILQVKGNQKKLLERCIHLVNTKRPYSTTTQQGKRERNRIEKRGVTVFRKGASCLGDVWDDHVQAIIQIKRETRTFNTKTKRFDTSKETALYIATTDAFSAREFGAYIRSHWAIENSNHYVKDVSLHEDFSRIRKNPENVATLRSFALNLLRINSESNISQALYRNATNVRRILNYVGVGR